MPLTHTTLLEETLKLLRADTRSVYAIANGSGLNYFWVRNMKLGNIKEPGILKVEQLHKFLTSTPTHA